MQLFAFEENGPISALKAAKANNYTCPECKSIVRLRSGPHRQPHFYHLKTTSRCRQSQKGLDHLHLQLRLHELIGEEADIERAFPEIGRIADVAWEKRKIIFEVQCSPISQQEVEERNADYAKLGFFVVWILHDKRYNQKKLSSAEYFLRKNLCYFTNIDTQGKGEVYDQFEVLHSGRRLFKGPPLNIHPAQLSTKNALPQSIPQAISSRTLFASGDLLDRLLHPKPNQAAIQRLLHLETRHLSMPVKRLPWTVLLKKSYRHFLDFVLQKL